MRATQRPALVTGATGMVGYSIVQSLLKRGIPVRVLVRSREKALRLLPPACEVVVGDVTAPQSLGAAVLDCEYVFHAAGFPEQWMKDHSVFDRVNADGTRNMLEAARHAGVRRFVFTSTIDVFTWRTGAPYDESRIDPAPKATWYERSKQKADALVAEAMREHAMDCVFLHPSGVYGPAPSDSPGTNELIVKLAQRQVPLLLPGGYPLVFAPDVGEGHVIAALQAPTGARYILSESYAELNELSARMLRGLGMTRPAPRVMPLWLGRALSTIGEAWAAWSGKPPLIPAGQLQFLQVGAFPDAARSVRDLGLSYTPLDEGLRQTIAWLRQTGKLAHHGTDAKSV